MGTTCNLHKPSAVYPGVFEPLHLDMLSAAIPLSTPRDTVAMPRCLIVLVRSSTELPVQRTEKASKRLSLSIKCHQTGMHAKRRAASVQLKS